MTFGVRSLQVRFGDVIALDDITIDIAPGAVVAEVARRADVLSIGVEI